MRGSEDRLMDDEAIKTELTRFKGVGPKTAACVLMFCLQRPEFPVDVHVRPGTHLLVHLCRREN